MMKNTKKSEAEKQLIKFDKEFCKLLAKYPEIFVAGDINGDLVATFSPKEPYAKTLSAKLPSYVNQAAKC